MIHYPQGLEDLEHLQYWFGADGFYSQSLQRPKRYEKSKFKAMMRFQKLYAGEPVLKAQAPVDPNSEDPRTMGQLPPHPPLHMTKFGKFERGEEVPDNVLPGSHRRCRPRAFLSTPRARSSRRATCIWACRGRRTRSGRATTRAGPTNCCVCLISSRGGGVI